MALTGIRWSTNDRYGNDIYLTNERWQHIIDSINHPDMKNNEEQLRTTIRTGRRTQDPLNPQNIVIFKSSMIYTQIIRI